MAILSLRQVLIRQLLQAQAEEARVVAIEFNNYLKERLGNAELEAYQLQLQFLRDIQQRNVNVAALSSFIEKIVETSSDYDSAALITNDGRGTILGQSNLNNPLPNNVLQRQEYFQLAVKTKKSVLTLEPALSLPETLPEKPLSLFVATPILDAQTKRVIAVLRLRISAANLRGFLQQVRLHDLAHNSYLVNQQGRIVVASEAEAEGKPLEAVFPQLGVQGVGRQLQQLNNRPVVVAAQALSAPFKSLVLAVDESTILQPVQTITWVMVLCGCAFVFLLAGVAVFLSRRQVAPLLRLIQAVEEISAGNFDIHLPVRGNDELTILSQTVNQMVDQLQFSLSQIQVDAQEAALLRDAFLRLSEKSQRQEALAEAVAVGRELLACDRVIFTNSMKTFVGSSGG